LDILSPLSPGFGELVWEVDGLASIGRMGSVDVEEEEGRSVREVGNPFSKYLLFSVLWTDDCFL
jgi:hypothetical protein